MTRRLQAGAMVALLATMATAFAADPQHCATILDSASRLACYDAVYPPVSGAAAPAPAPAAAAPAPTPAASENFGKPAEEADSLDAHIAGSFKGFEKGTRFTLDNGQVWKVESDTGYYPDAPDNAHVTIERGVFGAYYMKVDGIGRKIKVRRVVTELGTKK